MYFCYRNGLRYCSVNHVDDFLKRVKTTTSDLDTLFWPRLLACHQGITWVWFPDGKGFPFYPELFATLPQREKTACGTLCPLQRWDEDCAWLGLRPSSVNQDKNPGNAYTRLLLTIPQERIKMGQEDVILAQPLALHGSETSWKRKVLWVNSIVWSLCEPI